MQGYSPGFARIYNMRWANFAQQLAPRLLTFYESTPVGEQNHKLLDLCCGTGQLALYFLDQGYQVTGLDLSEAMLEYARANTAPYLLTGQVHFVRGDASNFRLEERFGLVASTFDALNHLPDFDALQGSFRSVYPLLEEGGWFVFDLNTRLGLRRWNSISVEDSQELMLVTRSLYDESGGKACMRVSGFVSNGDGLYERFEETAYEVAFDLMPVREALLVAGFQNVYFARSQDFSHPVEAPENEARIFIVAEK